MSEKWALLVGIGIYDFMPNLQYAPRDAEHVAEQLIDHWEFPDTNVRVLTDLATNDNLRPTKGKIGNQLEELKAAGLQEDDLLFFFFSGHGLAKDRKDYLVPSDSNPTRMQDDGIRISRLVEELKESGSRNIVMFIDACRNELAKEGETVPDNTEFLGVETATLLDGMDPMIAAFFSCEPQKRSYEIAEDVQSGAFTYELLRAMKDDSGVETIKQLNEHLESRVPTLTEEHDYDTQLPHLVVTGNEGQASTAYEYALFPRLMSAVESALIGKINARWEDESSEMKLDKTDGPVVYAAATWLAQHRKSEVAGPLLMARNLLDLLVNNELPYGKFTEPFLSSYDVGRAIGRETRRTLPTPGSAPPPGSAPRRGNERRGAK